MTARATSEVVAIAWLLGVAGLTADVNHVGVTLPGRDDVTGRLPWEDTGFAQMVAVVGGSPDMYVPNRQAVVQLDFWAANQDSGQPPWGKARELAELVIADTYDTVGNPGGGARTVTSLMPTGYNGAVVRAAWPNAEPRRVPNDPSSYARLTMDLTLAWVELT